MTRPPQEALAVGAAIVVLPWVAAVVFGALGKPWERRVAGYVGWAAAALVVAYLGLDSFVGFGHMSAFYLGMVAAVGLGALLAWAINRSG